MISGGLEVNSPNNKRRSKTKWFYSFTGSFALIRNQFFFGKVLKMRNMNFRKHGIRIPENVTNMLRLKSGTGALGTGSLCKHSQG